MSKEDYVSLEVEKILKEKGFKESENFNKSNDCYSRPTLYDVQKWLMDERNIFIVIIPHYVCDYEIVEFEYRISTYIDLMEQPCKWISSLSYYEYYEECLNAAIFDALKMIDHEKKIS